MKSKRDITEEEESAALAANCNVWNLTNPSPEFQLSFEHWQKKLIEAKTEGYKSEKCDCGCVFLAFHHFTTCRSEDCPFSDGVSLKEDE